jgi:hypothetical protein
MSSRRPPSFVDFPTMPKNPLQKFAVYAIMASDSSSRPKLTIKEADG